LILFTSPLWLIKGKNNSIVPFVSRSMEFLWQIFNLLPYRTNQYFTPNFPLGFLKELRRLEN
jgi:hypothetical protein